MAQRKISIKVDATQANTEINKVTKAMKQAAANADTLASSNAKLWVAVDNTKSKAESLSKSIDGLGNSSKKSGSNFDALAKKISSSIPMTSNLAAGFTGVSGAVLGVAAAFGTTTAAITAFIIQQSQAMADLEKMAGLAGLTVQQLQAFSFGAVNVGVSVDKFSDILKDVNDKIGDFVQTGGGEFKDVFEGLFKPMGITLDQIKEMSSVEVLGALGEAYTKAGSSVQEYTFFSEALANDLTAIMPLLKNNSELLYEYAHQARDMGLIITPEQQASLKAFNTEWKVLKSRFETLTTFIAADLAPAFQGLLEKAGSFLGYIGDVFGLTTQAKIKDLEGEISTLNDQIERSSSAAGKAQKSLIQAYAGDIGIDISGAVKSANELIKERDKMLAQLKELQAEQKKLDDLSGTGRKVGGTGSTAPTVEQTEKDKAAAALLASRKKALDSWLAQVSKYNLSEAKLNERWRDDELAKLDQWHELNKGKEAEYQSAKTEIQKKYQSEATRIAAEAEARDKEEIARQNEKTKQKRDALANWLSQVMEYNLSEAQLNESWRDDELARLEKWRDLNKGKEAEYQAAKAEIQKRYQSEASRIADEAEAKEQERLSRQKEKIAQFLDGLSEAAMTETQLNDKQQEDELAQLDELYASKLVKKEEYEQALADINQRWADENVKIAKERADAEAEIQKKSYDAMASAFSSSADALSSIGDIAANTLGENNAFIKASAVFQATANLISASIAAMNIPTPDPFTKIAAYTAVFTAGIGFISQLSALSAPSRQIGGYMQAGKPYQVGGGAHTKEPELYQSGGKSYIVDSNAGTMTRANNSYASASSVAPVSVNIYNNVGGVSVSAEQDSQGNVNAYITRDEFPQLMSSELSSPDSDSNRALTSIYSMPRR